MTISILSLAIAATTPLLLCVLGELFLEKAGVINIGLEGLLLIGALGSVAGAQLTGSVWGGFAAGIIASLALASVFGVLALTMRTNQVVTGAAINFLALGLSGVAYRAGRDGFFSANVPSVGSWSSPLLSKLPLIGPLFRFDPVIVFSWIVVPVALHFLITRTRAGLRLRACGEAPQAARAVGVPVRRMQWLALFLEATLAGLAGGYLALALSSGFAENMSAGRGFIALAIVIFGRWKPLASLWGAALFGVVSALQYALQANVPGFPFHAMLALPYLVTLALLAFSSVRVRAPAALGE